MSFGRIQVVSQIVMFNKCTKVSISYKEPLRVGKETTDELLWKARIPGDWGKKHCKLLVSYVMIGAANLLWLKLQA